MFRIKKRGGKTRAADGLDVEIVLITLGTIAHDSISSNIIWRTNTTMTLIELARSPISEISVLSIWCLNQICRSPEIAQELIKTSDIISVLRNRIAFGDMHSASMAVYCIGNLIQNDSIAEFLAAVDMVPLLVGHLRKATESQPNADHISAGLFSIARMSRSIKLAKVLTKVGCVELISHHLNKSTDPNILNWSTRAVGCLMRPNSSDMARALLDAGVARGLARVPLSFIQMIYKHSVP
ncbi:hypothetical protein BT96DRAFT_1078044 [Gymnopus androsaceus JB14]|uniref:ARM repeat-containing protein n=1 Tax=Gymnopus androsaceus JB14 TaxID=1447944 RepID=A0A6A4IKK1_9AGAR|nr:hypothetical protein BT96DRAFT_1078044 [Gymnopus androsaceus JB14]